MTRAAPRTHLHSSRLIRQLADMASADFPASRQGFAERLGSWLDVQDAITLSATLHPNAGRSANSNAATVGVDTDLDGELARLRHTLHEAIISEGAHQGGRSRLSLPIPGSPESFAEAGEFAVYHRYYVGHQRDMDSQIGALRANLRAALARRAPATNPQLLQLALLDAALDKALAERERSLLAAVPLLLEKRFLQLRSAHRHALTRANGAPTAIANPRPPEDDPASWLHPGGWLAHFRHDLQQLLLAELDLRLEPLSGLVEAYRQAIKKTHP